MFDKAENTENLSEKRSLYNQVSDASTVSAEKRKKALDFAAKVPNEEGTAPRPSPYGTPPGPRITPTPYDSVKPQPVASSPTSPGGEAKFDASAQKKGLMAKMQSGRASMDELRMLKSICMAD